MELPTAFSVKKARYAQKRIFERIIRHDVLPERIEKIAGVDVAYRGGVGVGSAVVVKMPEFKVVDSATVVVNARFPYIPTLLAFREVYPAYAALKKLKTSFDILMVDGNGLLHPYRAGFACHLGLVVDKPSIGIAKKLLCGYVGEWRGKWAPVLDNGETIGAAVKTSQRAKPIYVSIGHKISLRTAIRIVLWSTRKGVKLPEPIRQAHICATQRVKTLKSSNTLLII